MSSRAGVRVSVVVPVFNMGRFLPEAVASIEAQGFDDFEIIVVDDGSTDETPAVIAGLGNRVTALHQDNRGPSAARNTGLDAATGEFVAFLDADDLWPDGKLETQLERFERDPDLDVVLGRIRYVALDGGEVPDMEFEDADALTVTHVHLGSGVFRREAFEHIGTFEVGLRFSEDVDWFLRAREAGLRMVILPDVTLVYRLHDSNMTREVDSMTSSLPEVLKRSLERRRAAGNDRDLEPWKAMDERAPDTPTVSVVIPAYNAARYLRETIRSVLQQTHRPLEIIVVDDGSSDATAAVARRFGSAVRVISRENGGPGAARNTGFREVRGEFVALLDADNIWVRDKLERQLAVFDADPTLDMVFGGVDQFVSPEFEEVRAVGRNAPSTAGRNASSLLMRRDVIDRVGSMREDVDLGEFLDWYDRALAAGCRFAAVEGTVVWRRIHDSNIGVRHHRDRSDYARVLKAVLDRRRATESDRT